MTKNLLILILLLCGSQNLLAQSVAQTMASPMFQQTLSYEVGSEEPCFNGNQIKAISDKAGSLLYDGSFDFKDGANEVMEYFYAGNFVFEDGKLFLLIV